MRVFIFSFMYMYMAICVSDLDRQTSEESVCTQKHTNKNACMQKITCLR